MSFSGSHIEIWLCCHARASRQLNIYMSCNMLTFFLKLLFWVFLDKTKDVFLIKKKRDDADDGVGCSCESAQDVCGDDCECRCIFCLFIIV